MRTTPLLYSLSLVPGAAATALAEKCHRRPRMALGIAAFLVYALAVVRVVAPC
jgi:hypothetical protein